jgi:hypothetical protein
LHSKASGIKLSISRLVELLDTQTIPRIKVGTHRRIRFGDLMNYKNDRDTKRQQGLSRMTKKSQQLDLYTKATNNPEHPQEATVPAARKKREANC